MTPEQLKQARIIRKHYGLTRPVTLAEVEAEIANLQRKAIKGLLDNSQEHLYAALGQANWQIAVSAAPSARPAPFHPMLALRAREPVEAL